MHLVRMPSPNKYLWTQIKWQVEKQASEGKREGPQGNKLRVYFVLMSRTMDFLPGLYFLAPLPFYVARGLIRNAFI